VVILLRTLLGILVAIAAATIAVPILVLADLAGGGSGWGLCPGGLSTCSTSYFAGPELAIILLGVLFVMLGGSALCLRALRKHGTRQ